MPKRSGRKARKPQVRAKRPLKRYLLIVVEGDTGKSEQVYFQQLARFLRSNTVSTHVHVVAGKGEPNRVLDTCLDITRSGRVDQAFLVVNVDQHPTLPRVLEKAEKERISGVVTNPQFEQWLY